MGARDFTIQLSPKGKDFVVGVLPNIERAMERGIRAGMHQAGELLFKTLKAGIEREPKTGRYYKRKDGPSKKASAPGQYAGTVTADYLKSLSFTVSGDNTLTYGFSDKKATWLEEGTKNKMGGWRMKPRPALANATAARQSDTFDILARKGLEAFAQLGGSA